MPKPIAIIILNNPGPKAAEIAIDSSMLGWDGTARYLLVLLEMLNE